MEELKELYNRVKAKGKRLDPEPGKMRIDVSLKYRTVEDIEQILNELRQYNINAGTYVLEEGNRIYFGNYGGKVILMDRASLGLWGEQSGPLRDLNFYSNGAIIRSSIITYLMGNPRVVKGKEAILLDICRYSVQSTLDKLTELPKEKIVEEEHNRRRPGSDWGSWSKSWNWDGTDEENIAILMIHLKYNLGAESVTYHSSVEDTIAVKI